MIAIGVNGSSNDDAFCLGTNAGRNFAVLVCCFAFRCFWTFFFYIGACIGDVLVPVRVRPDLCERALWCDFCNLITCVWVGT